MIESKTYVQISNFGNINHKTKVHAYALPPYLWKPIGSPAFR